MSGPPGSRAPVFVPGRAPTAVVGDVGGALSWLAERRAASRTTVTLVPFAEAEGWHFVPGTGDFVHETGRFFTIEGLRVRTDQGRVREWDQPIINQSEIAILGILMRRSSGGPEFLMQAKIEPGNLNAVQLSPTVQATPSNYTRVHGGTAPRYLEYFVSRSGRRTQVDVLHSEQGAWFHRKRNRNMIVEIDADVPQHDDFRWFTLSQLVRLLQIPNVVNADARTVLSCLSGAGFQAGAGLFRADAAAGAYAEALRRSWHPGDDRAGALHWITDLRSRYRLDAQLVPLSAVQGWHRTASAIERDDGRHFRIVAARVEATSREVTRWSQPLVEPCHPGLVAFLVSRIDGVLHVLVQARVEAGTRDVVELAPTVQCQPGDLTGRPPSERPAYLDHALLAPPDRVRYDVDQPDEGGRFLHSQNRHLIVEIDAHAAEPLPEDYRWVRPGELAELGRHSNYLNIQARSLLLCLFAHSWPEHLDLA